MRMRKRTNVEFMFGLKAQYQMPDIRMDGTQELEMSPAVVGAIATQVAEIMGAAEKEKGVKAAEAKKFDEAVEKAVMKKMQASSVPELVRLAQAAGLSGGPD